MGSAVLGARLPARWCSHAVPSQPPAPVSQPAMVYPTFVAPDADPGVFRIEDPPIDCP
jgi:hypothetical protein